MISERETDGKKTYISTKSRIKHDILIHEMRIHITSGPSIKRHDGQSPVPRNRVPVLDIRGDVIAREEPDVDAGGFPLHGVDAAAVVVEAVSVGVGGRGRSRAAVVAVVGIAVGVREDGALLGTSDVHGATGRGVEGDGVLTGEVDALEDVNFAGGGPVRSK